MTKRITVLLTLPSLIGTKKFSLLVAEGSRELQLTVAWPKPLTNLKLMHSKQLAPKDMSEQKMHPYQQNF